MNTEKAKQAQIEVCTTAQKMYHSGLVSGTWGNISSRIDGDYMVITPSGMDYDTLTPDKMVVVDMHTLKYEGTFKPSIETIVHAQIYLNREDANGIMHTHSTYALSVATARKEIPPICEDQVQILGGSVKLAPYAIPGTKEMAQACLDALKDRNGALIANHGAITLGPTLDKAFIASMVLEKTAQVYLFAQSIGGPVEISQKDVDFYTDFFNNKYGQR